METAFIALGSNCGVRAAHLREAAAALTRHPGVRVRAASPVYESAAHTLSPETQPPYLNAVLEVETDLSPEDLLAACLAIEAAAGRVRSAGQRWEARTLDLDVLLYGSLRREADAPLLPHPRMAERRFVLQPLADLAPRLHVPPPFDDAVETLLARCPDRNPVVRTAHGLLEKANLNAGDRYAP